MAAHGISLDSRLPTAVAAAAPTAQQSSSPPPPPPPHGGAPPPSPPLSLSPVSLPAASLQHPHQYQQDTHTPSESSTDSEPNSTGPNSRALLARRFALHCYDSTEELVEAYYMQERSDSDVEYHSSSSGRALAYGRQDGRQERNIAEAQDDLEAMSEDDASSDAQKQAQVDA